MTWSPVCGPVQVWVCALVGCAAAQHSTVAVRELEIDALPVAETVARCVPLPEAATVLATSPEGHLWIQVDSGIEVVDPHGAATAEPFPDIHVDVASETVVAWSSHEATIQGVDGLRLVTAEVEQLLGVPGTDAVVVACGEHRQEGYVLLSDGTLYEQRRDAWWAWPWEGPAPVVDLVPWDGQCLGPGGALTLLDASGDLWRLRGTTAERAPRVASWDQVVGGGHQLGVVSEGLVWTGGPDGWIKWSTDIPARTVVGAGDALWFVMDDAIVRFASGDVERLAWHTDPGVRLLPHSGGLWTVGEQEACNHSLGASIQVSGLRPYTRTYETRSTFEVTVAGSDGTSGWQVEATAAGVTVPLSGGPDVWTGTLAFETPGVRALVLTASRGDVSVQRSLWVEHLGSETRSWEADLAGLQQQHCAGAGCHGDSVVDLSTRESWVQLAPLVRARVLETDTMPPAGVRDGWGSAQRQIIEQWLDGGMLP